MIAQKGFFRQASFGFQNVALVEHDLIPTKEFLYACEEFVKIFDILGKVAFLPIKIDINGNIEVSSQ
jgi:hypothetical protein